MSKGPQLTPPTIFNNCDHPHVSKEQQRSFSINTAEELKQMDCMEGVVVDNLLDFDLPPDMPLETAALGVDGVQHPDHADIFSPKSSFYQNPTLQESLPQTKQSSEHQGEGDVDSDATESADSENDMDPSSFMWELRRLSSSSVHIGEDTDAETLETRQFMKTYVEKVFHGK